MLLFVTIVRIASTIIVTVCVIHVFYNFIIIIITYISYNPNLHYNRNLTLQPQPYITTATLHYNRNLTLQPQSCITTPTLHYNLILRFLFLCYTFLLFFHSHFLLQFIVRPNVTFGSVNITTLYTINPNLIMNFPLPCSVLQSFFLFTAIFLVLVSVVFGSLNIIITTISNILCIHSLYLILLPTFPEPFSALP